LMFVCAMTGMALTAIPVDASAKCPVATAVVTGSLDLPREMDRVAVGVFLDNFESGRLVWLESPAVTFEVPVRYYTLAGPVFLPFVGHDCSRQPSTVELVVTDGEQLIRRRRMSWRQFSLSRIGASGDVRIDLGQISFR